MIRRLPHTQVHIEAVQPRDIRLEHMAELENIPMVNHFVGKRTYRTDELHVFSDSILCCGRNNSNSSENWPHKLADIWI